MFQVCVVALVGLPASGKTSFCRSVLGSSIDLNVLHVCYDDLFTFLPQNSARTFKEERAIVLQHVERIITSLSSDKHPLESVPQWKRSSSSSYVILCDDNHYYAGMRYELYKICRNYGASFAQIYLPLNPEEAMLRNRRRLKGALPPEIVKRMSERLEAPSTKNQWERESLTIERGFDPVEFLSFVHKCLQNPVKTLAKPVESREENSNAIHELDLLLRKGIKTHLQSEGGDLCAKAKMLNERRKAILQEAKEQPDRAVDVDYFLEELLWE